MLLKCKKSLKPSAMMSSQRHLYIVSKRYQLKVFRKDRAAAVKPDGAGSPCSIGRISCHFPALICFGG